MFEAVGRADLLAHRGAIPNMNAHAIMNLQLSRVAEPLLGKKTKPIDRVRVIRSFGDALQYALVTIAAVICVTISGAGTANAGGRVALLLGAEKYEHFKPSKIKLDQVKLLAIALAKQGFEVSSVDNPSNASARAAFTEFSRRADGADFALIVLTGHFATYRRQSFFLPTNAHLERATDLFSRGLSVRAITDIASKAASGAVIMMMTVADISSAIDGISQRPDLAEALRHVQRVPALGAVPLRLELTLRATAKGTALVGVAVRGAGDIGDAAREVESLVVVPKSSVDGPAL